jgi:hypothetical protein
MSEVDRLSNSGLFPALPIADRRFSRDDKERRQRPGQGQGPDAASKSVDTAEASGGPQPPKSHIDEYA